MTEELTAKVPLENKHLREIINFFNDFIWSLVDFLIESEQTEFDPSEYMNVDVVQKNCNKIMEYLKGWDKELDPMKDISEENGEK